jgi:hypothetical protein
MDDSRKDDMLDYSVSQADCSDVTIEGRLASAVAVRISGSKSGRQ